jgi:hypothetical protein
VNIAAIIKIFLHLPGERKNFKSVLPPIPAADMAFVKTILENIEKIGARKNQQGSEVF